MLYLFWKVLACWPPIHGKMGDPTYGGHAIGKRTLNLIIQWLRRSPIGKVNGRTLVRYWNTSVAQWRLAWRPQRGRIRRVFLISRNEESDILCFITNLRNLRTWYGHPGLVMWVLSAGLSSQFVSQLYAQWLSTDPANAFCRSNNNPFSQVSWVNVPLAHLKYRLHVVGSGYSCSPKGSGQLLTNSIN